MPYSQFTLATVKKQFNLRISEENGIFAKVPLLPCSTFLAETLRYNVPLALSNNTEKARSEMIIAPILIEMKKQSSNNFSLFSGVEFEVESEQGLAGYCDFILSRSPEQLFVTAPVVMLVEAKKENINNGLGQCVAEMVAAQRFNQREQNLITIIYGVVTTGTNWKFLRLQDQRVEIDLQEYYVSEIEQILGILNAGIGE